MAQLAALRYLRLTPFDVSHEQGRSDERYRLALISVLANVLSKGMGMVVMILSIRLTVPYLGAERFGVWMTVASLAGLLTFLDLGIGNALTNHVAKRAAADNTKLLSQTISGGLAFLAIIGVLMSLMLWAIAGCVPWSFLIKTTQVDLLTEARTAAMYFGVLFGLNVFTGGIQKVFSGLQQSYVSHIVTTIGSMVAGIGLWFSAASHAGIPVLLAVMLGSQSVVSLFLLAVLAHRKLFCMADIASAIRLEAPHLFQAGGLFFLLQIGTMVGWGADSLIISSTLGAAQVAMFAVTQRLFQFISQPLSIINAPLWGAYADANSRKEKEFIKKTLKRSIAFNVVVGLVFCIFLAWWSEEIIRIWTNGAVIVPASLVIIYAAWSVIDMVSNSFAMFMNGCNIIRPQVVGIISLVFLAVPIKLYFAVSYGLTAMLSGFVVVYLVNIFLWYGMVYKKQIFEKLN